jgi:hypothetical protein
MGACPIESSEDFVPGLKEIQAQITDAKSESNRAAAVSAMMREVETINSYNTDRCPYSVDVAELNSLLQPNSSLRVEKDGDKEYLVFDPPNKGKQ